MTTQRTNLLGGVIFDIYWAMLQLKYRGFMCFEIGENHLHLYLVCL